MDVSFKNNLFKKNTIFNSIFKQKQKYFPFHFLKKYTCLKLNQIPYEKYTA